jgi:type I restriction enzyme, S subunit
MFAAKRSPSLLQDRINADFYAPLYTEIEARLNACGIDVVRLGHKLTKVFKGAFDLPASEYTTSGVPFIRVTQIAPGFVELGSTVFISHSTHTREHKTAVRPGHLLFAKGGAYRHTAAVPDSVPEANICQDLIGAVPAADLDSFFAQAFLSSRYGRPQLIRWQQGDAQPHLTNDSVKQIWLLFPQKDVQFYVGDKVRQAERLRERARALEGCVQGHFAFLTTTLSSPKRSWRVVGKTLEPYRINPKHYDTVVLEMTEEARKQTTLHQLGELLGDRDIAGGATPLGATYQDSGVFFVRVQNVKPYRLDLSDAAYLSGTQDAELARSRCAADDIVFSITGYPGTASLVLEDDLPVNINQHSVRFNIRGGWQAAYVTAALNSRFGQLQVNRFAIGGTRDALDYPSVRSLLIPELAPEIRAEIASSVSEANRAVRYAQRLTIAAKHLVEALIEGKVTETDLKDAHGNRDADRAILQRLTRSGIDVPNELLLFSNLDDLYAALDESADASVTVGTRG